MLRNNACARAELYIRRANEMNDGTPYLSLLWRAAEELEAETGCEDDCEGVELAFSCWCEMNDLPLPTRRRA